MGATFPVSVVTWGGLIAQRDTLCLLDKMPFQGITSIVVVFSFLVSADGPDYVSLWTRPDVFAGVLTAVIGSSGQLKCTCLSGPGAECHWIRNSSLLGVSEENVTLPGLSWEQMGSYRCIVQNLETGWPCCHRPAAS